MTSRQHRPSLPPNRRLAGLFISAVLAAFLITVATFATHASADSPSEPAVSEVSPAHGPPTGGTSVKIAGENFAGAIAVKFGASEATSFEVNSSTEITAISPAGQGIVDVTVTTPEGISAVNGFDDFRYAPIVTKIEPDHGQKEGGTPVTFTGFNFTGATAVKFGGVDATSFTVNSDTSITAISPAVSESGIAYVAVVGPGGRSEPRTNAENINFAYGPIVEHIESETGPAAGGTAVTISGRGLESANAVSFGSTPVASFSVNEDGSINAVSPPFAGGSAAVPVTVTTPEGVSVVREQPGPPNLFIYGPTVSSVSPSDGTAAGGTRVTIGGTGFSAVLPNPRLRPPFIRALYFGSTPLSCGIETHYYYWPCEPVEFEVDSESEITAVVPPGTGAVDVTIETAGGKSPPSSVDRFSYGRPEGTPGPEGSNLIQLVSCRTAKSTAVKSPHRQRRAPEATAQVCTSKLISGPVGAGPLTARLMRGNVLYATGTATVSHTKTKLALKPLRQVRPGRYRLTLASRRGLRHESITIR